MLTIQEQIEKYLTIVSKNPNVKNYNIISSLYLKIEAEDKAFYYITKSLKLDSNDISSIINLGKYFYLKKNYHKSYLVLKDHIEKNRLNIKLLNLFHKVCNLNEKYIDALKVAKYILFVDPVNNEALKTLKNDQNLNSNDNEENDHWTIFDTSKINTSNLLNLYSGNQQESSKIRQHYLMDKKISILKTLQAKLSGLK